MMQHVPVKIPVSPLLSSLNTTWPGEWPGRGIDLDEVIQAVLAATDDVHFPASRTVRLVENVPRVWEGRHQLAVAITVFQPK